MDFMNKHKVLLLTGPGGSGKTTIAELLCNQYGYTFIDGDQLDTEFFPKGGQWDPENNCLLKKAHDKILTKTKAEFDAGKNVVVAYIIFNEFKSFFSKFKKTFGNDLNIKILFPSETVTIQRDKERECWTTGTERIRIIRNKLLEAQTVIGAENFVDTSALTPEETAKILVSN